jgi:hypothetical protein
MNPIAVTGCLTGSGDRFVLTSLERENTGTTIAAPATETYQLIGKDDDLRPLVGKQVSVTGRADTAEVAVIHESVPPSRVTGIAGTPGQAEGPKVSAESETRIEVSKLKVASVRSTGEACAP